MSKNRVNTGDAGYIKLLREPSTGYGVPQDPGSPSTAIVYNQGGVSIQDERETVPRRGVAGLGPMEQIQLRGKVGGGFTFDQELQGHSPLLLGMFGAVESKGTVAPFDNFFSTAKDLPTWNVRDHWPGTQDTAPAHEQVVYTGCWFDTLEWALTGGDPMTAAYTLLGAQQSPLPSSAAQAFDAKPYYPIKPQTVVKLTWGSHDLKDLLHSWSIRIANNGRGDVYPTGLKFRQKPYRGAGGLTVEFTAEMYPDNTYYDGAGGGLYADWINDAAAAPLTIQADRGSTERLVIYVPLLKPSGTGLNNNDHGANVVQITGMAQIGTVPFSSAATFPVLGDEGQGTDVTGQMIGVQYSTDVNASTIAP